MTLIDLRPQALRRASDELARHLESFELTPRFSAGIWYFSPADSRFHERYGGEVELERRLEIAASLAPYGLEALEAHCPNEINEDNMETWKKFQADTGIRLVTVIPLLFRERRFEFGSLSCPVDAVRREAIELVTRALLLNREMDTDFAVVWPGIDGYENPFGIDINPERMPVETAVRNSIDAIRAAADRVNGLDHESIVHAVNNPGEARGWLEAYLIRARARRPENLPPLAPLRPDPHAGA